MDALLTVTRHVLRAFPVGVAVGIGLTLAFLLVNLIVLPSDPDVMREKISEAFADGTLPSHPNLESGITRAGHECIMLSSHVVEYESRLEQAISPKWVLKYCTSLWDYLTGAGSPDIEFYHRYLHGHRTLSALLLRVLDVSGSATFMLGLTVVLILMGMAKALVNGVRHHGAATTARERQDVLRRTGPAAIIFLSLGLFFGLPEFGATVTDGSWHIALVGFLIWTLSRDLFAIRVVYLATAAGLFGAFIAHFEFWVGAAPLGLAAVIASVALSANEQTGSAEFWSRICAASAAYCVAFMTCFLVKIGLVGTVFGWGEVTSAATQFVGRASSSYGYEIDYRKALEFGIDPRGRETYSLFSVGFLIGKMAYASSALGFGSMILGIAAVGSSIIAMIVASISIWRRNASPLDRRLVIALLLSASTIVVWYLLFLSHTIVHTRFMVRTLVWFIAMGGTLAWIAYIGHRTEKM